MGFFLLFSQRRVESNENKIEVKIKFSSSQEIQAGQLNLAKMIQPGQMNYWNVFETGKDEF